MKHRITLHGLCVVLVVLLTITACVGGTGDTGDTTSGATDTAIPVTDSATAPSTETPTEAETEPDTTPAEVTYTWNNPTLTSAPSVGAEALRDPFILKVGDKWYMTGTMPPYYPADEANRTKGMPLYVSEDLKTWSFVDIIIKTPAESEGKWYSERFWAPEIFQHNGKFYATVNCCRVDLTDHGMLFAVADNIEGPYTLLNPDAPLVLSNDAHLFVDDDGRTYLFGSGNWHAEIDLETLTLLSEPIYNVVPVAGSTDWNGERKGVGFEGPYVLKRNGMYYMFYSTWGRGYEIGIATATDLDGTWTLAEKPFYGAMNQEACDLYGTMYEEGYYTNQDKYKECGHNSVFIGPDGEYWLAAHAYETRGKVKLVIDRITFTEDGEVAVLDSSAGAEAEATILGPSYGEQSVTYTPIRRDQLTVAGVLPVHRYITAGEVPVPPAQVDIRLQTPSGVEWRECVDVAWETVPATDGHAGETLIVKGLVTFEDETYETQYIVHVADANI